MLYRAQNICAQTDEVCVFCGEGLVLCCTEHRISAQTDEVCVFLERALCCTEHRISVHKLIKCVCFVERALCCVVQSTEYLCTN